MFELHTKQFLLYKQTDDPNVFHACSEFIVTQSSHNRRSSHMIKPVTILAALAAIDGRELSRRPSFPPPCDHVHRKLLASRQDVSQAYVDAVLCVLMQPGGQPQVHAFGGPNQGGVVDSYMRSTLTFARHLAPRITQSGAFLVMLSDDATLPLNTLQDLSRLKVPLLSHALRGRDKIGHAIFMPDFHFIDSNGFAAITDQLARHQVPFEDKRPVVFWRGSTTGMPHRQPCVQAPDNPAPCSDCLSLTRVQAALRAKNVSWLDIELTNAVQVCASTEAMTMLDSNGILSESIQSEFWHLHRGLLDVDGNTNAWGHLWRMLTGSVVFKVESDYYSAYNHAQKPWVHYVPVSSDLVDLELVTSIIASNEAAVVSRLQTIAKNAMQLARQFTMDNELDRVARELDAVWNAAQSVVF